MHRRYSRSLAGEESESPALDSSVKFPLVSCKMFIQKRRPFLLPHPRACEIWIIFAMLIPTILPGADPTISPVQPVAPVSGSLTNPPVRQLSPGRFQVGEVRFDHTERTIGFPAAVNLREGNLEYVIVHANGKTHESLLRTTAEPLHVQLAFLLLGARGAGATALPLDPAEKLPGETVRVELSWLADGKTNRMPAEEFVHDRNTGRALSRGPFVYTGSRIREDGFAAQLDGSIVSLITDADALVNNPRRGREDDDNWLVRTNGLPPLHTPVEVTIRWVRPGGARWSPSSEADLASRHQDAKPE